MSRRRFVERWPLVAVCALMAALSGAMAGAAWVRPSCVCSFAKVAVVASTDAWEASGVGGGLVTHHWHGGRWRRVGVPRPPGSHVIFTFGVGGTSPTDVWGVGEARYNNPDAF